MGKRSLGRTVLEGGEQVHHTFFALKSLSLSFLATFSAFASKLFIALAFHTFMIKEIKWQTNPSF
jgi:hypothetical protein